MLVTQIINLVIGDKISGLTINSLGVPDELNGIRSHVTRDGRAPEKS